MAATLLACSSTLAQSTDTLPGFDLERLETNVGRGTVLIGNGQSRNALPCSPLRGGQDMPPREALEEGSRVSVGAK